MDVKRQAVSPQYVDDDDFLGGEKEYTTKIQVMHSHICMHVDF